MPPLHSRELEKRYITTNHHARQPRTSPCEMKCLVGNHIQKVHTLLAAGEVDEALAWLHARNPFPGITGRVCPHPCQTSCNRLEKDEGLAIHNLERYAADHGKKRRPEGLPLNGKRIAVIGAGPAGLAAAHFAGLLGYEVDVYESSPVMGGVPRQAIPDFRLPKDIVDRETAEVLAGPVRVFTNVKIGRDATLASLLENYDACLLATGLWKERILDLPGKEHLQPAVNWLKLSTLQRENLDGRKIVILGGGGVAFDCAFTARRLNAAEVSLVFLEDENSIRAPKEEVIQAREEGIVFYSSMLGQEIRWDGEKYTVLARKVSSFKFEKNGSLEVKYADAQAVEIPADLVICASGLMADEEVFSSVSPKRTPRGIVEVDAGFRTSIPGLFAAGDIAFGPGLVGSAIAQGRKAALSIHATLAGRAEPENIYLDADGKIRSEKAPKAEMPHIVVWEEIMNPDYHESSPARKPGVQRFGPALAFRELGSEFSHEEASAEAARCMHCGHCMSCGSCVEACPGHILEMAEDGPEVSWPEQCWHCGCCRIACPTGSISYRFPLTMLV